MKIWKIIKNILIGIWIVIREVGGGIFACIFSLAIILFYLSLIFLPFFIEIFIFVLIERENKIELWNEMNLWLKLFIILTLLAILSWFIYKIVKKQFSIKKYWGYFKKAGWFTYPYTVILLIMACGLTFASRGSHNRFEHERYMDSLMHDSAWRVHYLDSLREQYRSDSISLEKRHREALRYLLDSIEEAHRDDSLWLEECYQDDIKELPDD